MLASKLEHPSICTVYEVGELDGDAFIAMQYIPGESLRELIDRARNHGARCHAAPDPLAAALSIGASF